MPRIALTLLIVVSLGLAAFFYFTGGEDTHASLTRASVSLMTDINKALAGIEDEKSAESARPELERLNAASSALAKRMKELSVSDKSDLAEAEPHVKRYAAVTKVFNEHVSRLERENPKALAVVWAALSFYQN